MRTVNRVLSLLARLDPAHRRSRHGARRDHGGHGHGGHGHGHGAQQPVPELLAKVRILAGLTVLDDGSPVFLLDVNQLGAA